jgi:hypothetical protein
MILFRNAYPRQRKRREKAKEESGRAPLRHGRVAAGHLRPHGKAENSDPEDGGNQKVPAFHFKVTLAGSVPPESLRTVMFSGLTGQLKPSIDFSFDL